MNLKSLFFSIMLLISPAKMFCPEVPPAGNQPNMALTPEGAEIMEAALQEFAQAFEKMTPDEKEQFFKIYDEMSQLPPEELSKMVNDQYGVQVFAPAEPGAPVADTPVDLPVEPSPLPEPAAEEPAKSHTSETKQKEAVAMLTSIIERINSFLHKTQIMPEFAGKLKKWTEQGKVKGWQPAFTWAQVKKDISSLVANLEKIKEQDKKTKTYKFLDDFIESPAYSNLNKLNDSLIKTEPTIVIEELGFEPVSKESRKTMRQVLGALLEALYILAIPADLNTVIEKFEPSAKKSREAEDVATKKAIEESKRERFGRPGVVAGYGDQEEPYYGGGSQYGQFGGSDSGYYSPSYQPYSGSDTGYQLPREQESAVDKSKKSGEGSGTSTPKTDGEKAAPSKETQDLTRFVNKIDSSLDEAAQAILTSDSRLRDINKHLLDNGGPDLNTANSYLPNAIKKVQAATDSIERLKRKAQKSGSKYKSEVKDLYDEHKKTFDEMLKQIKQAKTNKGQISPPKKQAFFGEPAPQKQTKVESKDASKQAASEEAPKTEATTRSLLDLETALEKLKEAVATL